MLEGTTLCQPVARRAVTLVIVLALLLPGCAPAGRSEACDAIRVFSRNVGSANMNYAELSVLTARLSDDLYAAARLTNNQTLRADIRYAAGAAQDVTTVIRNRASRDVMNFEIDILIDALDQVRFSHC